ncbi:hypothetical protein [Rufibacter tibetensis]|uniref:Uncharacterized protein n=1 Tax=Rufibacter tibetensis TaxID=512763 RepID=A0A0P0D260_9BACT|nr:hypothetical protein [Rufibacter tibetensis]ALJ01006.1 hypothetical protein DC20_20945 [Rufibacter tibetensis]
MRKKELMEKVCKILFLALGLGFFSCSDEDGAEAYKVRYVVDGDGVEEIKYNINNINYSVKKSFANGWDTTFTHPSKQKLQLQAKAKGSTSASLAGTIFLNDVEVAKQVDQTKDSEGKFEVKAEHQIQ